MLYKNMKGGPLYVQASNNPLSFRRKSFVANKQGNSGLPLFGNDKIHKIPKDECQTNRKALCSSLGRNSRKEAEKCLKKIERPYDVLFFLL